MSAEAATLIAEILLTPSPPPLATLHFFNNMSGDGGGVAVAKIISACGETLQDIRFSATRSMATGCQAIVESLSNVKLLKHLDLSDNNFGGAKNGQILVNSLQRQVRRPCNPNL